jgi:hypothetical protein
MPQKGRAKHNRMHSTTTTAGIVSLISSCASIIALISLAALHAIMHACHSPRAAAGWPQWGWGCREAISCCAMWVRRGSCLDQGTCWIKSLMHLLADLCRKMQEQINHARKQLLICFLIKYLLTAKRAHERTVKQHNYSWWHHWKN